ncbi:hypothetical protein F4677DRAFT_465544 [Hypoxylon crocopeplum]|nr:hypothetical protein F4677DRAFT_465544 [Hypoxylon crocopeplum]
MDMTFEQPSTIPSLLFLLDEYPSEANPWGIVPDLDPFPLIVPAYDLPDDESHTRHMSPDEIEALFVLEAATSSISHAHSTSPKPAPYVIDLTPDFDAEDGFPAAWQSNQRGSGLYVLECPPPSVLAKRKQHNPASPRSKRRRRNHQEVNIQAFLELIMDRAMTMGLEDFTIEGQVLFSNSFLEPFAPASGWSTSELRSTGLKFPLLPTAYGDYFPTGVQTRAVDLNGLPIFPNTTLTSLRMEEEYGFGAATSHSMERHLITYPPFPESKSVYPVGHAGYEASQMWAWTEEGPVSSSGREHRLASPLPSLLPSTRDCDGLAVLGHALHGGRRRINLNTAQQKTIALQGVLKEQPVTAVFKCNYPNCQKGPFKRREHLKRHKNTKHAEQPTTMASCPFCDKPFNRRDNYRQHLKLHTRKYHPAHRTKYHPHAQAVLDEEVNESKR